VEEGFGKLWVFKAFVVPARLLAPEAAGNGGQAPRLNEVCFIE